MRRLSPAVAAVAAVAGVAGWVLRLAFFGALAVIAAGLYIGQEPLWWTLRRRDRGTAWPYQAMNYEALRAVFRRVNALLDTNWSMHDLIHTAALRMSRDEALTLRDVQTIMGHAHLSTTADIYLVEENDQVVRRVQEHLADRERRATLPPSPAAGYRGDDLDVLFGGERA